MFSWVLVQFFNLLGEVHMIPFGCVFVFSSIRFYLGAYSIFPSLVWVVFVFWILVLHLSRIYFLSITSSLSFYHFYVTLELTYFRMTSWFNYVILECTNMAASCLSRGRDLINHLAFFIETILRSVETERYVL